MGGIAMGPWLEDWADLIAKACERTHVAQG